MYDLVVIACERDLPLLRLQAQSMALYLPRKTRIHIMVNEKDPKRFFKKFKNFSSFYKEFKLKIYTLADFDIEPGDPYEDQQILKLAASHVTDNHLLILDCQNFLFRPYVQLPIFDGKIPYRKVDGQYPMDDTIWKSYCNKVGPCNYEDKRMGLSTPIYLRNDICRHIILSYGGMQAFVEWFRLATNRKSEFTLYYIWTEVKLMGIQNYHYLESDPFTWASPYLRDSVTFDKDFNTYVKQLNEIKEYTGYSDPHITRDFVNKCCWTSINHRAWGEMTSYQYTKITHLLNKVQLEPKFEEYRVDYKRVQV